jgi:hypothetical protein
MRTGGSFLIRERKFALELRLRLTFAELTSGFRRAEANGT